MSAVLDKQEVLLFGTRYPIIGPVQKSIITPFPGKVTEGQTTRDDEVVTSSWIQADWSGGIGIIHGDMPQHQDRFFDSRLETRYPNALTLLPYFEQMDADIGPAQFIIDYDNTAYFFVDADVYSWDETNDTFTNDKTFANSPTDVVVWDSKLWVCFGTAADIQSFDGTTWAAVTGEKYERFVVWDDKLFGTTVGGAISYTSDGATFTARGRLDKPNNWIQQLIVFFDRQTIPVIHAITRDGVYAYDYVDEKFYQTPMTWPSHPRVGNAIVWRSELYIPVGDTVYKWNNQTVQVLGPNKDEGVPDVMIGDITSLAGSHPFYYAVVSAAETSGITFAPTYNATPGNTTMFPEYPRRGVVMASSGTAFHPVYVEDLDEGDIGAVGVTDVQGEYRLWITTASGLYTRPLTTGVHNPLQNPTSRYIEEGHLTTVWFDNDWPEIDKLALSVRCTAEQITSTEGIAIDAEFDEDGEWTEIGEITSNGRTVIPVRTAFGGRVFRRCRFRIRMWRGSNNKKTPVLRSVSLSFMLRPTTLYGYGFTIDLNEEHDGLTPRQLNDRIAEAAESKSAGFFMYQDDVTEETFETMVVVSRMVTSQQTGRDHRSRVQIGLVQPQGED